MEKSELIALIKKIAGSFGIDQNLCIAIATIETNLDAKKVRYEPNWNYLLAPEHYAVQLGISVVTEKVLQSISWGPMQIMGSIGRQWGFKGQLVELVDPNISLLYSLKYLDHLQLIHDNTTDLISSWNQGVPKRSPSGQYMNQSYVDKVTQEISKLSSV